jgi:hypothetical protein
MAGCMSTRATDGAYEAGTAGNERITALAGALLFVLLAAEGVTIVAIRPLFSAHVFIGALLPGPVALKLGSTGYGFLRYYAGSPAYRRKGPPHPVMRLLAPPLVIATLVLFGSGVLLLEVDPAHHGPWMTRPSGELRGAAHIGWTARSRLLVAGASTYRRRLATALGTGRLHDPSSWPRGARPARGSGHCCTPPSASTKLEQLAGCQALTTDTVTSHRTHIAHSATVHAQCHCLGPEWSPRSLSPRTLSQASAEAAGSSAIASSVPSDPPGRTDHEDDSWRRASSSMGRAADF